MQALRTISGGKMNTEEWYMSHTAIRLDDFWIDRDGVGHCECISCRDFELKCYDCDGEGYVLKEERLSEDPSSQYACGDSVDWQWNEFGVCLFCDGTGKETK